MVRAYRGPCVWLGTILNKDLENGVHEDEQTYEIMDVSDDASVSDEEISGVSNLRSPTASSADFNPRRRVTRAHTL